MPKLQNTQNYQENLINYSLAISLLALVAALYFFQKSDVDLLVQNLLFDFQKQRWLIDRNEFFARLFFYKLPKILLGVAIVSLLTIIVLAKKTGQKTQNYRKILLTFLGLTLIPLTVGNIKKFTNIYCPDQTELYGGNYPYVKILDHYPKDFKQKKRGQCFPAGHAVTGFALFILFFVFEKLSHRFLSLIAAFLCGSALGFYQMAKGVHFLSDTVISMICCFLVAALIAKIFEKFFTKNYGI